MRALTSKKICVSVRWVTLWVRPPLWKYVCPFVGVNCGCVPPLCENMCVRSLGYIVGASPPCVCPFVGSLHAAYSALRHFWFNISKFHSIFIFHIFFMSNMYLQNFIAWLFFTYFLCPVCIYFHSTYFFMSNMHLQNFIACLFFTFFFVEQVSTKLWPGSNITTFAHTLLSRQIFLVTSIS